MVTRTIDLPEEMDALLKERVRDGQYSDESAYICALIRYQREYQQKLEALREAIREGEESGLTDASISDIIAEAEAEESVMLIRARKEVSEEEIFHYKILSLIRLVYQVLIGSVIGFMIFHQLLDYRRTRKKMKTEGSHH